MKYVLLMRAGGPVDQLPDPADPGARRTMRRYAALKRQLVDEGIWCGGEALQPPSASTAVQVRDEQVVLFNGAPVGSPDHLIGYYLVDCTDLDHAVDVATRVPAAGCGTVEVRPVWDFEAIV